MIKGHALNRAHSQLLGKVVIPSVSLGVLVFVIALLTGVAAAMLGITATLWATCWGVFRKEFKQMKAERTVQAADSTSERVEEISDMMDESWRGFNRFFGIAIIFFLAEVSVDSLEGVGFVPSAYSSILFAMGLVFFACALFETRHVAAFADDKDYLPRVRFGEIVMSFAFLFVMGYSLLNIYSEWYFIKFAIVNHTLSIFSAYGLFEVPALFVSLPAGVFALARVRRFARGKSSHADTIAFIFLMSPMLVSIAFSVLYILGL
ncbi:MAG TPA: hypothetical protein VND40_06150 [Nitrososphaerales archaeon]|nr:hypothetical protein [Nitrososphaerales archaeon]